MDKVLEKLREHSSPTPSNWRREAEERQRNLDKLKVSRKIALSIISKMKSLGVSKDELADKAGVTTESLAEVLKGKTITSPDLLGSIHAALGM